MMPWSSSRFPCNNYTHEFYSIIIGDNMKKNEIWHVNQDLELTQSSKEALYGYF